MSKKRNTIPCITEQRIDNTTINNDKPISKEDKEINALLKNKEVVQSLTIRLPKDIYFEFRKIAFQKNLKMNQIIVDQVRNYIKTP